MLKICKNNPNCASWDFISPYFLLFLCSCICTENTILVMSNRIKNSANHGSRRLLPLALPMDRRRPNHAYQPLPHIIGDAAFAWFGRPTCRGPDIWHDQPILKVLDYIRYNIFTQIPRCFCTARCIIRPQIPCIFGWIHPRPIRCLCHAPASSCHRLVVITSA